MVFVCESGNGVALTFITFVPPLINATDVSHSSGSAVLFYAYS